MVFRPVSAQSTTQPLVLAFYYTWYDQNTWTSGTLSDQPAQPYISSDRAVMARHIEQAQAAGIDGFLVAWFGPGGGNPTESNLEALLEEAAARNFRIGILFETDSPFMGGIQEVSAALQHALSVHAAQPAFLRADGRPVLFFWRTQRFGGDTWRAVRDQVDPGSNSLWIADGIDSSHLGVFDGLHLYSNTWNPPADLSAVNNKFAAAVVQATNQTGVNKLWVATAMPGYNDVKSRPGIGFAQDREGGGYYDRSWAAALASGPNWVVITSFNEWPEGSYIEPSVAWGDQYLNQTAGWIARFKGGDAAAPMVVQTAPTLMPGVDASTAVENPSPDPAINAGSATAASPSSVAGPLAQGEAYAVEVLAPVLYIRAGPGTQFSVVDQATQGEQFMVTGRSEANPQWQQVSIDGTSGWVSGEYVSPSASYLTAEVPAVDNLSNANEVPLNTLPVSTRRPVLSRRP
jgi:hypothetical protein